MASPILRTEKICKSFSNGGVQQHVIKNLDLTILDACLEERGMDVPDPAWPEAEEIVSVIPTEYDGFAGAYAVNGASGDTIGRIVFLGETGNTIRLTAG